MFSKKNSCDKKIAKGFTLVEIIVVLVILAILAAATIPSLLGFIDDAKFKTIDNEARVVRNAAQAYATEQSAGGKTDEFIEGKINGVINSTHALHNLLQNDANGTVFETKVESGKIRKFKYTKEIVDANEDLISDKIRYAVFDDEKASLLHATGSVATIDIDDFEARMIAKVTAALTSSAPESFKSTLTSSLTTDLNSSLESGMNSKISALKTNFRTELGSSVVDLVYPVGSYYVSHSSTSPATLFGGTWTQITNRFLYCANSSGTTGGSSNHTHEYKLKYIADYSSIHGSNGDAIEVYNYSTGNFEDTTVSLGGGSITRIAGSAASVSSATASKFSIVGNTSSTSTMPPYTTVYCWRRTA